MISMTDVNSVFVAGESEDRVRQALAETETSHTKLLQILSRYTTLNCIFGSCVAGLAGRIGRSTEFIDQGEPLRILADRSVLVASYVFDAARDEFDDRDTSHRDTHRCLAQAFLRGIMDHLKIVDENFSDQEFLNKITETPEWLEMMRAQITKAYGVADDDDVRTIFHGLGYHLGSEIFAIQEFTMIDKHLREKLPSLFEYLQTKKVMIAGVEHNAYSWPRIHSSHGKDVEQEHFDAALVGVNTALRFAPKYRATQLEFDVMQGMRTFSKHHSIFFQAVAK